ncbi:MAG: hypothetical protein KDC10_04315 [Calditrichaeota bacterium]|nr:hypothetical protein [Candidatus Cloacimonadota bacterium]MCB1046405.1 hypothetical protein [Calditrichota bacterium]MCB9474797.1 hypothetical protein [Candidatus Delongbacteria bacterium]
MSMEFRVSGIRADELRLWSSAVQAQGLRERRAHENRIRRLWKSGESRPEWCLLAREGMVPLGSMLLLREDRGVQGLLVDELNLPWQGAWRGLAKRLLAAAIDTARAAGARQLVWHLPSRITPDPEPAALERGFVAESPRTRFRLDLASAGSPGEEVRSGWIEGLDALVLELPEGQRESWRDAGDSLLSTGGSQPVLAALNDGDGGAEILAGENPELDPQRAIQFPSLVHALYRRGCRRLELECTGAQAPDWFGQTVPNGPPAEPKVVEELRRLVCRL